MGNGASTTKNRNKSNRAQQLPCLKIAIIGDCGVGKTSILVRYVHNQFSPVYSPTHKVAIENIVRKVNIPNHALASITFWDIPGREEFDLYKSYFTNLDAAIVVVDLSEKDSLEMALVWKQLLVNNMYTSTLIDSTPGVKQPSDTYKIQPSTDKYTVPILLLANKLDIVEELNKEEEGCDKLTACVNKVEEYGSKHNFTASVCVSARNGDDSVHQAIQSFIRLILEKYYKPTVKVNKDINTHTASTRTPSSKKPLFQSCGIKQIDEEFERGEKCLRRIQLLIKLNENSLNKFKKKCIKSELAHKDEASLESCVVALKKYFCSPDTEITFEESGGFCTIQPYCSKGEFKMATCYEKIFQTFNNEYSVSVKTILNEFPELDRSLSSIDTRISQLCEEYSNNTETSNTMDTQTDYDQAKSTVEFNRATIVFYQNQIKDKLQSSSKALSKIKTAFLW
ncbi:hypothetical protein LOTGIDRAFT_229648 [Lottia gigantea]|uniref:Uncharacterized protein n=1 Tax=Lottia gigantea TaxID=225164 RepID=V3Z0Y2_LOTGI|nr:hypothetical protein LOTGIDRAFT_229648 [Lottia gigantea]ESO84183.1 hypothetical protein LOTGIDRAFT_229648 [Lottia gigantea]